MSGWIGFDFDGTLATYDGWKGASHLGEPVPAMVELLKKYLAEGTKVKILTARVSDDGTAKRQTEIAQSILAIQRWCLTYIGQFLPITCVKDMSMWKLYDDRAIQVEKNTGKIVGQRIES